MVAASAWPDLPLLRIGTVAAGHVPRYDVAAPG
ncbi:hypothetical protein GGQ97_002160 [Sphingomonas kaistensis]|uniref:Uncharacterized protein n=1 Tax=Sphingomonas kaistensis TaxID=298708 RepID=A0A7X6BHR0_9SPHN|nr:hypothetical protein [Sphingomonas kaistensis]